MSNRVEALWNDGRSHWQGNVVTAGFSKEELELLVAEQESDLALERAKTAAAELQANEANDRWAAGKFEIADAIARAEAVSAGLKASDSENDDLEAQLAQEKEVHANDVFALMAHIRIAPHGPYCATGLRGLKLVEGIEQPCNCWKASIVVVLGAIGRETR